MNPSYSTLTVMQKPSWVRPPTSYKQDTVSSLSVAFKDPDGTKSKAILAEQHLYLFSIRATVKKWKYRQMHKDKLLRLRTIRTAGPRAAALVYDWDCRIAKIR